MTPTPVAIAVGSNLGNRLAHLHFAFDRLQSILDGARVSRVHETAAVGVGPQGPFLNAAVIGMVRCDARDLLHVLLAIERERGRQRPFAGAPRTLDLDLILFGDAIIDEPLAELAADWRDPESGLTVGELRRRQGG